MSRHDGVFRYWGSACANLPSSKRDPIHGGSINFLMDLTVASIALGVGRRGCNVAKILFLSKILKQLRDQLRPLIRPHSIRCPCLTKGLLESCDETRGSGICSHKSDTRPLSILKLDMKLSVNKTKIE